MNTQANIRTFSPIVQSALDAIPADFKAAFDMNFDISERIHAILTQKGMTQKQLAALLGKRESEVSKWLTGRHNFTIATIARISAALGEDIILVAPQKQSSPKRVQRTSRENTSLQRVVTSL